jgi:hypothetical protein
MHRFSAYIIIIFLSLIIRPLFGQISSDVSDFKVATAYSKKDTVFVFNQSSGVKKGQLKAKLPGIDSASFEWSAFDTISKTFSPPFKTDMGVDSSMVGDIAQGGYLVHITKTGLDTTFTAWVFLNDFTLTLEKNVAGEVLFYRRTCEYTNLQATAMPAIFTYFNPATKARIKLSNSIIYTWSASPSSDGTLPDKEAKIWIEGDALPSEDTEYTCRGTDKFNLSREDKVKYISIIPKADFTEEHDKKYEKLESAPLKVTLTNKSTNATKFTWIYGDGDTVYIQDPEPHLYTTSDTSYNLKLIAESQAGCTREDTATIKVSPSELEAANVFTPNGLNPYFFVRNVSLREFNITIFTRTGRKVYEFHGPDINSWEGWDGKIGNSDASPGVYFYVIEALSWENPAISYKGKKYAGFVYLFRD